MTDEQRSALKKDVYDKLIAKEITKIQFSNRMKSIDKIRRIENK